jgi:hypothetical protein
VTTTTPPTNTQQITDARRARTLRWLLKVTKAQNLPMPKQIGFSLFTCCGDSLYCLTLELDDGNDVTGWAKAINAETLDEFEVTGDTHQWTSIHAATTWRLDGPGFDWNHIEVRTRRNYRPHGTDGGQ